VSWRDGRAHLDLSSLGVHFAMVPVSILGLPSSATTLMDFSFKEYNCLAAPVRLGCLTALG
jgi:hypothetical protein